MTRDQIADRTREIIADTLCKKPEEIADGHTFNGDLKCDSLDCIEIVVGLETEFDCEIGDDEAADLTSVRAAIDWLAKRLGVDERVGA